MSCHNGKNKQKISKEHSNLEVKNKLARLWLQKKKKINQTVVYKQQYRKDWTKRTPSINGGSAD